jgi:hypothetical protein
MVNETRKNQQANLQYTVGTQAIDFLRVSSHRAQPQIQEAREGTQIPASQREKQIKAQGGIQDTQVET